MKAGRRKRFGKAMRYAWGSFLVWASESSFSELVSAVGTVVGSALISISGSGDDRWLLIGIGALVITIGLVPTWAKSMVLRKTDNRDALLDARSDVADAYVRRVLEHAPEVITLARSKRVALLPKQTQYAVDDIWENYYSASDTVRVIFFAISGDKLRLEPTHQAGRSGEPRGFDATSDKRGELAIERLDIDDPFELHSDVNELPAEWDARDRSYVAFLSVPVRVGGTGYGLISIDSERFDELDERDGEAIGAYASALGFYFAAAAHGKHGRTRGRKRDGGAGQ